MDRAPPIHAPRGFGGCPQAASPSCSYRPFVPNSGTYGLVAPLTGISNLIGLEPLVARPLRA